MGWAKRPVAHVNMAQAAIDFAVNRGLNMGLNMGTTFYRNKVICGVERKCAKRALLGRLWRLGASQAIAHKLANLADMNGKNANFADKRSGKCCNSVSN